MVVLIVESVPARLRGQLSKWMLEPKAGVFVGTVSAMVRDLLWAKACEEVGIGGCTMVYQTDNEQGFAIRTWGDTSREVDEWEGLFLVRRPYIREQNSPSDLIPPEDWNDFLHLAVWAKTSRGVKLRRHEGQYHPLICHMIDTAMVAWRIWQRIIPLPVREQIRRQLGVQTVEEAGRWIAIFAGLHDLGKATPIFAKQWPDGWSVLTQQKYGAAAGSERKKHEVLSTFLLSTVLTELNLPPQVARPIARILGGHHGKFPTDLDLKNAKYYAGSGRWEQAQIQLTRLMAKVMRVDHLPPPSGNLWLPEANSLLMLLAGLTSVSDWIASNHDYFTFAGSNVRLPDYRRQARLRAQLALRRLGWYHRPRRITNLSFEDVFERTPNRLQEQVIELTKVLNGPSLVLLEYPMGGGKTEAALFLADHLAGAAGQKGAYFALPSMATSNQMFGRVNAYLAKRFRGRMINTQLLHGHAALNSEFKILLNAGKEPYRITGVGESKAGGLVASEWFTYRKRGLLAPYGIGTIDQALLAVLQSNHFFVRLFGLSGKVLIVDEVHAYDTYMQALLGRLLLWLGALGTSVILLSATLPAAIRQKLFTAYAAGRGLPASEESSADYPRVSWLTETERGVAHIVGAAKRSLQLEIYSQSDIDWVRALAVALVNGGTAAVILNTVARAQSLYELLCQYFATDELFLFHARYPFNERAWREQEVLACFGPKAENRPHRAVVVATQVIEQSLDLDFDLMVTDLAPIDLILQRSGRLWRHPQQRPIAYERPSMWVLLPDVNEQGVPDFEVGARRIYGTHVLLRTWLAIGQLDKIEIPEQVEVLVESVYQMAEPPSELSSPLQTLWQESQTSALRKEQEDEDEAASRYIPNVHEEFLFRPMSSLEEESEGHPVFKALTRLGGPSVMAICLLEEDERLWAVKADSTRHEIRLEKKPDMADVRALLGRSISLALSHKAVKSILSTEPPPTWRESAYLRHCRLLRFDGSGQCLSGEMPLRLDPVLGLIYVTERKEGEE